MPTILQERLAKNIIENEKRKDPLNKGELLISSEYAPATAEGTPGKIIERKGVQEALEKYGFTEDNAKRVVAKILNKGKEDNRLRAADLVFKVKGSYAPVKTANINAEIKLNELTDEELAEVAYKQPDKPKEAENDAVEAPTSPLKE